MIGAPLQCFVQIESRDAATRSFCLLTLERQQDGRSAVALHDTGGHDPNHTWVPALPGDDQGEVSLRVKGALDIFGGLLEDFLIHDLATLDESIKTKCQRPRLA